MDREILESLKNFDSVWKRVRQSSAPRTPEKKLQLMPGKVKKGCAVRFAPYNK